MSKTITDDRELLQVRLWARVNPFDVRSNDCAVWGGHRLPAGYGTLQDPRTGKPIYAHRLSWELIHGEIPEGHVIRHLCNNPSCVRPAHLTIGTQQENMEDRKNGNRGNVLDDLTDEDSYHTIKVSLDISITADPDTTATITFKALDTGSVSVESRHYFGNGEGEKTTKSMVETYKDVNRFAK